MSWRIRGSYFESCNCDAICPCRRIDGVPGGRSTHGDLHRRPLVADRGGRASDGVDLSGLAGRDGHPLQRRRGGLAVDVDAVPRRARDRRAARRARRRSSPGGSAATPSGTSRGRGRRASWSRCGPSRSTSTTRAGASGCASATTSASRIRDRYDGDETVTLRHPGPRACGRGARRRRAAVEDGPLEFTYRGICGYASTFDYAGMG